MRLFAISGSLRRGSLNSALLRAAGGLVPPGVAVVHFDGLAGIPPYSEDLDVEPAPAAVAALRREIAAADGLLLATPEYNASIPGQLKNAIDWASRPFPDNALRGRPAAVIGASTGIFGAVWAQAELRKVLATAGADVLDRELVISDAPGVFDDDGRLIDNAVRADLDSIVAELQEAAASAAGSSSPPRSRTGAPARRKPKPARPRATHRTSGRQPTQHPRPRKAIQ